MDMKKIITCAALLAGIVFFNGRLNAQVESDIVGYQTIEITSQWTLLGMNFVGLENDTTDEIPFLSMISGDFAHGDEIQVQNIGGGYSRAGWNSTVGKWCSFGRTGLSANESTLTIPAGTGFWLKSSATTIQIAGKVYTGEDISVVIGKQYKIFAPLVPEALPVNSDLLVWENFNHNDEIQIPNAGGGYSRARWNSTVGKWCTIGRTGVTSTPSDATIPSSASIWVISTNDSADVTVKSIISK